MISVTWPDCGRILRAAAAVHNFAIAETIACRAAPVRVGIALAYSGGATAFHCLVDLGLWS